MTPTLDSPETTDTSTDTQKPFPYTGDDGTSLPAPSARGILCSSDNAERGRAGSTACPVCGEPTVNGVGLFSCTDCEWTGICR